MEGHIAEPLQGPSTRSIKRQARLAGLLYLLLAIIAPIGLLYVPDKLIARGDPAATADRIRNSEWLFRVGIGSELTHQVIVIFLVLVLYRLFKPVNEIHARQLVILGALVSVPIMFANVLNELLAMTLAAHPDFMATFTEGQLDALSYLFLRLHEDGITVVSVFWGLWLFPFGMLVIRSRFIPAVFGVLLIIAGSGYLIGAFSSLVVPQLLPLASKIVFPMELAEIPIVFWLLIWGARARPAVTSAE